MPSLLVTGGTGFIGHHIVSSAQSRGFEVSVISRSERPKGRLENISSINFIKATGPQDLSSALDGRSFDYVIHAASPGISMEDRSWDRLNSGCSVYLGHLLNSLASHPPKRILNLGSWSEYAFPNSDTAILSEKDGLSQRNIYGAAKASAHLLGHALSENLGLDFVTTRLFNIYGPGEAPQRLLPYVIQEMSQGRKVDLTPGLQERDFLFVKDAVDGLFAVLLQEPPLQHKTYNLCTGKGTSVRDMVRHVIRSLDVDPALANFGGRAYRSDEPLLVVGDPSRTESDIGWTAKTDVQTGIEAMVDFTLRAQSIEKEDGPQ